MKEKRGNILTGNVIFIILSLVFLSLLILFIFRQGAGINTLEQSYSKQIALLIDSAKPGMKITLDMEDAKNSGGDWFKKNYPKSVRVNGNIVTVQLSEKSGYEYSFFNDVKPSFDIYPEGKIFILIKEKNE
jgi:hypothetical protein